MDTLDTVDLTASAALVVFEVAAHAGTDPNLPKRFHDQSSARLDGVLAVWQSLTGTDDRNSAIAYADALAESYRPVTANVPPF